MCWLCRQREEYLAERRRRDEMPFEALLALGRSPHATISTEEASLVLTGMLACFYHTHGPDCTCPLCEAAANLGLPPINLAEGPTVAGVRRILDEATLAQEAKMAHEGPR